jgi:hypothetical protein
MQMSEGSMQPEVRKGLKPTLQKRSMFLACQLKPASNVVIGLPDNAGIDCLVIAVSKVMLNHNVLQLALKPQAPFACEPGLYITVMNDAGVARSYSVANNPAVDDHIELHIRLLADGLLSGYVRDHLKVGDSLTLRGPAGTCFYVPEEGSDYAIVSAGTGQASPRSSALPSRHWAAATAGRSSSFMGHCRRRICTSARTSRSSRKTMTIFITSYASSRGNRASLSHR